jgi:translation initiation factor IF-2
VVVEQPVVAEPEMMKTEVPELEGPKVINKIDLSTIDSSTRPKKETKKKEEEKEEKKPAKKKGKKEEVVEKVIEEVKEEPVIEEPVEDVPPVIENIKADKLEGPKILGKIDLPVENDTRPKHDEKRKRKRIPIEKKEVKREDAIKDKDRREDRFKRDGRPGGPGQGGGRGPGTGPGGGGRTGPGTGGGRRDNRPTREEKVIDEKEIQEKIRETQAKLAGAGGRGKSLKAKYRKAKREEAAEAAGDSDEGNKLQLTEFISVSELANLMDVNFTDVISKCMGLGIMVSINQRLDAEVIELVASEFGFDVEFIDMEKQMEMEDVDDEDDDEEELQSRSPIVTIMGHVDHGKTSLLDYIRRANVVAGEAGGITQHIGAYQVELPNGKEITFLDTPGHEAFTAMRARGAKVTDIAVIVIAADDAVMPQTKEAISHAQAAGVPMIFAVNKIDKDGANSQKIYEQLSQMNLLVEAWGGKFQSQEISAKKGLNVDQLLEKILLEAELLDLKANPEREASGTIIEATLDKGRGYVATVLVQNGTLKGGDLVVSGQHFGRVKAMFNERNKKKEEAPPSAPVLILGLNGAPQAGEKFRVYDDEAEAKEVAYRRAQILREQGIRTKKHITLDEIGRRLALGNFKELNVIIKGDVDGSVEALSDSLQKLSTEEIVVRVIHKGVGQITESDVTLANASDAIIIGFNVRPSLQASRLAENESIEIKMYSIIYKAIEELKMAMEGMLEPTIQEKIVANVEIREVFKFDKTIVAGCYVRDGKIKRDSKVRLIRDGIVIYPTGEGASAELASLKRFKDDVKEVQAGMECGLMIKNYSDIKVGDVVEAFEEEEVKRTL